MSALEKTKPRAGRLRASVNVGTGQDSNETNDTPEIRPSLCPRYERCSAPICPMDRDWRRRTHLKGEPACGLLLELAKSSGEATLRGVLRAEVADAVVAHTPVMLARYAPLRRASEKAAGSGSRLANLRARNTKAVAHG